MNRLLYVLIVWNVVDAAVHILGGQAEFLRIASNLLLIALAGLIIARAIPTAHQMWLYAGGFAYVVLNGVFIMKYGVGGPLFLLFVSASAVLSVAAARRAGPA